MRRRARWSSFRRGNAPLRSAGSSSPVPNGSVISPTLANVSRPAQSVIVPAEMDAVMHRPGEGERHAAGGNNAVVIKATSEDTGGSLFLSESTIDPGFPGPPPHRHERLHDM